MEDVRLRKSCEWEDTTKYRCGGDISACVYTHETSLDLAAPKKPIINTFLWLNQRGMLIAPNPLPRLFSYGGARLLHPHLLPLKFFLESSLHLHS